MRQVHRIRRLLALLLAPSLPFSAAVGQREDPAAPAGRDSVDAYIERAMARQHIPGLSLAVVHDGRVVKARGYGFASLEHEAPATPSTVYELASTTKPFVATAILLLAQDGKLRLDDRLSQYVDSVPAQWSGVTIRHLLTHTSGIKDYLADLRHDFSHDTSPAEIARVVLGAPPNFAPGAKWSYSNSGYVLLGMVVQRVSGESYDAFLARRVFVPLGMTATRRDTPDEIVAGRASGYLWYGPAGMHNGDFLKYLMTNHGDRGLLSTALDLARWDVALSGDKLLTSSTREAMWRRVSLADGSTSGYGLGWFVDSVRGHRHVYHPGGAPGTAAVLARYPDDRLTVIVLTNGGAAYPQALDLGVARHYVPALGPGPVVALPNATLDRDAGFYNAFGSQLLTVRRDGNTLALDDGGRIANRFVALSDSGFAAEDADRGFTIRRGHDGAVRGMTLRLLADTMSVQRIGPLPPATPPVDPDSGLTRRIERVLRAFELGGKAVEDVAGLAAQARRDYARWPAPEFAGIRGITFLAAHDVAGRGISRHGAEVARVLYYRLSLRAATRTVLVYLTPDGLVTDQDVVD
jgi:CubicO group peptidase (beta-lactamase class C family)